MIESLQPLQSRTYWKSNLFKHCKLAGPFSGKIPGENSRRISREMAFFPVPMQMSFAWSHPYSFRKNLDIPFPSKQFPWKCLISRGFPFPCRKIPWNYRFPKSRANQNCWKKHFFPRDHSRAFSVHGNTKRDQRVQSTRIYQVRMIWYDLFNM